MAAERISENELSQLKANNQKEARLVEQPGAAVVTEQGHQLNREFHRIIMNAAGNARLARLVDRLIDDLERALSFDPYIAEPSQHSQIIQHLERHDKTAAQEAMRWHIEETLHRITNRYNPMRSE